MLLHWRQISGTETEERRGAGEMKVTPNGFMDGQHSSLHLLGNSSHLLANCSEEVLIIEVLHTDVHSLGAQTHTMRKERTHEMLKPQARDGQYFLDTVVICCPHRINEDPLFIASRMVIPKNITQFGVSVWQFTV